MLLSLNRGAAIRRGRGRHAPTAGKEPRRYGSRSASAAGWHAWAYDNRRETRVRPIVDGFVPASAEDLIRRILPLLTGDPMR